MENQMIEWKQNWDDEHLKCLSAFANTKGGILEIGKDDKGNIVDLLDIKKLLEDLSNKIRQQLGVVVDIELKEEKSKSFIRININEYKHAISYRGKYYYRSGSTTQELSGTTLTEFLYKKQGETWDSHIMPHAWVEDLSVEAIKLFRNKALSSKRLKAEDLYMNDYQLLENLLLNHKGALNRAAVLLFHPNPNKFVFGTHVKVARISKDIDYHDNIYGPIITLPDKVLDLIYAKYFKAKITYEGVNRIETFPVPYFAFKEALINAIIHKQYIYNNPIQIRIYDDCVEIDNEGKLPEDWTVDDLKGKHKSIPYNPLIANTFFWSGMIEAWGRGVERINEALRAEGRVDIDYRYNNRDVVAVFDTSVKLNFTENFTDNLKLSDMEKSVFQLINQNNYITTNEISAELGVTRQTISTAIKKLKECKIIKREGSDRAGYWIILI